MTVIDPNTSNFTRQVYRQVDAARAIVAVPDVLGGPSNYWRNRITAAIDRVTFSLEDDDAVGEGSGVLSWFAYGGDAQDCVNWERDQGTGSLTAQKLYKDVCSTWTRGVQNALRGLADVLNEYAAQGALPDVARTAAGIAEVADAAGDQAEADAPAPLTKKEWWDNIPPWVKWPAIGIGGIWATSTVLRALAPFASLATEALRSRREHKREQRERRA